MLYQNIYNDFIQARKDRDEIKKSVLSLLYNNLKNRAIDLKTEKLEDSETLVVIKKFAKQLDEEIESNVKVGRQEKAEELKNQKLIIEAYLPQQLTEEEIKAEIEKLDDKSMTSVMKHFKTNFLGRCDMSLVNKIIRNWEK